MTRRGISIFRMTVLACAGLGLLGNRLGAAEQANLEAARFWPVELRCEYQKDPLGIDVPEPALSWITETRRRGWRQGAYRILVASSEETLEQDRGDLWDSGRVKSDQSLHVPYAGKSLVSKATCYWKIRVWDQDGRASPWSEPARWTMGLLEASDWTAQWIAAPSFASDQEEVTVTKATYRTLDGSISRDVTEIAKKKLAGKKPLEVTPDNLGGDPARHVVKELVIEYTRGGKPGTARAKDFETINLFGAPVGEPAPLFRKEFELASVPDSALVTVHTPAYFELYVNGQKVGNDVLSPAVFNAEYQSFSLTYDVTRHLRAGKNCIGLWLGKGWAKRIVVRAQLDAMVAGQPVIVATDTSWETSLSGLCRIGGWKWGNFGGERLDARRLVPDWSKPGPNTGSWRQAVAAKPKLGPVRTQPCPANRVGKQLTAVAVKPLGEGKYEIDFGTALTGWLRLKMPALKPGTVVKMTFADCRPGESRRGRGYQHFKQISEFVSAGEPGEVFQHKFNYAAFRYVIVEGLPTAPATEDGVALLIDSDLEDAGRFECSNELLGRIHQVNRWTQRCLNLGGYYVDCPHRERMGYGDGQVAAEGFMTSFRADGFYRKWLRDWRLRQRPDGNLPHMAPFGRGGGGPAWGGLLSAITWRHYLYYGDRRVLEENYDAVRRYVDYLESICKDGVMRKFGGKWDFIGDWVPPRRGMDTRNWPPGPAAEVFNNCYRINQMDLLVKMATALGRADDAARYRQRLREIRPLVHAAFYDADKQQYFIDEQSYYVMPLISDVTPEALRPALLKKLEENILGKNDGHLDTGMLGTYFMMEYLREIGRNDLVFTMFNQTTYPGWGYMLAEDATTLWEQWNGYWSRVHSCFTSPSNWLYQGLAGIQADPEAPGFKNVIIKPAVVGHVTWVKAHHDSPYGRIVSHWQIQDGTLRMEVTIPANATGTVFVPTRQPDAVTESGRPADEATGVSPRGNEDGYAVFQVGSGRYVFESPINTARPAPSEEQER